jgi:hypothetical protein
LEPFYLPGLIGFGDWGRDHERSWIGPRVRIWTPRQPKPHERLKTCRLGGTKAMKKVVGLRHAADTYNYLFSSELKPPVAEILGVRATTRVTRIL